jgi:hypothetical protein
VIVEGKVTTRMFNHLSKIIALVLMFGLTVGCATKLAPKASNEKQEVVKKEVLQLLEKEYNQPFKIVDYSYSYDTHYPAGNCSGDSCKVRKFGIYLMTIESVNKPNVSLGVKIEDQYPNIMKKFKENYLPVFYCGALGGYFDSLRINHIKNTNKEDLAKAEELCNSRNQSIYYEKSKSEYLKSIK